MYRIAKDFSFCFGHRVWSQELDARYANDLQCACRHLHGHEAKVTVHLQADKLVRGMVTDFRHLEWLKRILDNNLDHKFVIDKNDPLFDTLIGGHASRVVWMDNMILGEVLDIDPRWSAHEKEYFESFFIVDFVPTSENFSRYLYDIVDYKMKQLGIKTCAIEWWESPKSRSIYSPGDVVTS